MKKLRILAVSLIFQFSSHSMISRKAFGSTARRFNTNVTNVILCKVYNSNIRYFNAVVINFISPEQVQVRLESGKIIFVDCQEFESNLRNGQYIRLAFYKEDYRFENGKIIGGFVIDRFQ